MPSGELSPETIAAIATPAGKGGIGIVRISGPAVPQLARALIGRLPEPRRATQCEIRAADGEALDQGIALYFKAPHSYTGEPVLELQGHGGPVVTHAVLGAALDAGARLAEPGEFTRRAFLNGKLDLAQAEAVADLIDAASREAARSALRSLGGEFSAAIGALVADLTVLRALTEAMLDFPEEEVDRLHRDDAQARLAGLRAALDEVLAKSRQGSLLRSGVHVVIAGRPNVGKSSLLNRLAGEERAIVTAVPGTTRDALRESIQIDSVPLVIVDTAGLRASRDEVEQLGMQRARSELARADVVLVVRWRQAHYRAEQNRSAARRAGRKAGRYHPRLGKNRRRARCAAHGVARGRGLEFARRVGFPRSRAPPAGARAGARASCRRRVARRAMGVLRRGTAPGAGGAGLDHGARQRR